MSSMISLTSTKAASSSNVSVSVNNTIAKDINPYENIEKEQQKANEPVDTVEVMRKNDELHRLVKASQLVLKCYAEHRYIERFGKIILNCKDLLDVFNEYLGIDNARIDCSGDSLGCISKNIYKIDGIVSEHDEIINNLKYNRPDIYEWLRQLNISTKYVVITNTEE